MRTDDFQTLAWKKTWGLKRSLISFQSRGDIYQWKLHQHLAPLLKARSSSRTWTHRKNQHFVTMALLSFQFFYLYFDEWITWKLFYIGSLALKFCFYDFPQWGNKPYLRESSAVRLKAMAARSITSWRRREEMLSEAASLENSGISWKKRNFRLSSVLSTVYKA